VKSPATKSKTRNRALIAKFAARTIAKNDRGIREHGGGLEHKNTLPEMMAEIMDLVNYAVEHEEQLGKLVVAADALILNHETLYQCRCERLLRAALAPFLRENQPHDD
jgi:hypothetical protein